MSSNHAHGVSATYGYDDLNRLTSVVDGNLSGSNTTSYTYDSANNLGTVTYPNGIESQFTYDTLNRVATTASQVSGYTYQRGPTGNLTNVVELSGRTVNWTYDGIYRLTNESVTSDPSVNGSVSYGLDPVGNRLSDSSSLSGISSGTWGYNSDDEVSSESYDANGNVTSTGGKNFTYDSENHLMSMTATGTSVSVIYDGDGNRVAKTVNGVTTYYLVDDLNPTGYAQVVEELSSAGAIERQYTYGLQRINENQPISNVWTPSFYGYDGGGSVRQLTNSAGTVTDSYEYDAFGSALVTTGSTPNNYLYRGEQYDPDLGLYYLRARYYNPATGRLMSRDPLSGNPKLPATLHKYLYVGGDPLNRIDPRGLVELVEDSFTTLSSVQKTVIYANTISCGINVGVFAVQATMWTSLFNYKGDPIGAGLGGANTLITAYGCLTITQVPEVGLVKATLGDYVGLAGCAVGFAQDLWDLYNFNKDMEDNAAPSTLGKDEATFQVDWASSMIGCAVPLLGSLL